MNSEQLFTLALGLNSPWEVQKVQKVEFVEEPDQSKELHIKVGFKKGAKFADESGALCGVHDTIN